MGRRIVIIGGGFSGLAAGVALSAPDNKVLLLERRNHLGGRAYSFEDPRTGDVVDNGQHLFLQCYHHTVAFLDRIGCLDNLKFQARPRIEFLDNGGFDVFDCPALPAPFHAMAGLFRMRGLSLADKLRAIKVGRAARSADSRSLKNGSNHLTVDRWLSSLSQSNNIKRRFWYPMAIATLNENPEAASATMMKRVIQDAFGSGGTNIGISRVGLSDLYTDGARRYIESHGGEVRTAAQVSGLIVERGQVVKALLKTGERVNGDVFISAVPHDALLQMLPEDLAAGEFATLKQLSTSPIVSINLWFDRPITDRVFIGLLGTRVQWLFNRDVLLDSEKLSHHIALIISAAREFIDLPKPDIVAIALEDLASLIPQTLRARLLRSVVVKERDATISHTVDSDSLRPGPRTSVENLILAGDWTATGLPATIESAVLSGNTAANIVASL